jgi:pSer/pThr/pTyr-binding forkhead associated (FHA) protein
VAKSQALAAQRPPAPDIQFSRRDEPPTPDDRVACPLCGSRNQRNLRFCVTCGHLLAQAGSSPRDATPELRPLRSSLGPAPIAPHRVVELRDQASAAAHIRHCPRCQGPSEGTAQFCRFCGTSFTDAPRASWQPPAPPTADGEPIKPGTPPITSLAPAFDLPGSTTIAMRSHHAPMRPRLVLIARDGGEGPTYTIGETTDLGRAEGDIVIAEDRYVSPRHARISLHGGSFFLRDLGSTNGIFVRIPFAAHDDTRAEQTADSEQPLGDQELFLVGQQVLRFEVVKHAEEGFGMASENGTLLFGTPAAPRYARLSQRTVEGVVRDVFHLRKGETVIGRESGDVVFTDDPFLSRRHAVVRIQSGTTGGRAPRRYALADLGSSNGTFLQIREAVRLRHGDHFRIGQQLFRFDVDTGRAGA